MGQSMVLTPNAVVLVLGGQGAVGKGFSRASGLALWFGEMSFRH